MTSRVPSEAEERHHAIPRQRPSATDRLVVADRPAASPRRHQHAPPEPAAGGRAPAWPELLSYYRDAVRAAASWLPLLDLHSGQYICLPGRERVLAGDVDDDECVPLPGADLVPAALQSGDLQLWAGWPTVVVLPGGRRPRPRATRWVAPLLMRQVELVGSGPGRRLRPIGGVVPHPGLVRITLSEDEAQRLAAAFRSQWQPGDYARMAEEARRLLRHLAIPIQEDLQPADLAEVDRATSIGGARNAAILFGIDPTADIATRNLLADLADMIGRPSTIAGTALAVLLDDSTGPPADITPPLVTPAPANTAQRGALIRAMTQRLTVVTGPPGTGKTQLVVNVVATAVANRQRVLVASTNNRAVDEVWERCEKIAPGLLIRTGDVRRRPDEAADLDALCRITPSANEQEVARAAFQDAVRRHATVETHLWETAIRERRLLALGRIRTGADQRLGRTVDALATALGTKWSRRARAALRAPFWAFGHLRRHRLLVRAGIAPYKDNRAELRAAFLELAESDQAWQQLRNESKFPSDNDVARMVEFVERRLQETSASMVAAVVRQGASAGRREINDLLRASRVVGPDRGHMRKVLDHVRGWAVPSLSARRFPCDATLVDLVIIDEASQCSIASVLPLLYRARRALLIGDAMQLPHISTLPPETDDELRRRHAIAKDWLTEHRLSAQRHSAFAAAAHAADETLLLDEHYRCHPDIIAVANRLFYRGRLVVLTDMREHPRVPGAAISWRHVAGRAERGPAGTSWRNRTEADAAVCCVHEALRTAPEATIGVVTPYHAQAAEIHHRLVGLGDRVRVGTAHAFQGGERDIVIMSLVAAHGVPPPFFDWADRQRELWNVAITRPKAQLIVIGDETVWEGRGGVGRELLTAARAPHVTAAPLDDDLTERLSSALSADPDLVFDLGVTVQGQWADAVVRRDGVDVPVVVDRGAPRHVAPEAHLLRMLRRRALLGDAAVRVPGWRLCDERLDLVALLTRRSPGTTRSR